MFHQEKLTSWKRSLKQAVQSTPFLVFVIFAFALLLKCYLFNAFAFESFIPAHKKLRYLAAAFCGMISASTFVAAFTILFKRNVWSIVISALFDIWCIANLIYLRCNGFFINYDAIKIVDQLNGFESSILSAVNFQLFLFPIITIIYSILLWKLNKEKPAASNFKWRLVFFVTVLSLTSLFAAPLSRITKSHEVKHVCKTHEIFLTTAQKECLYFMPFCTIHAETQWTPTGLQVFDEEGYIRNQSILAYLPAIFVTQMNHEYITLTDKDIKDPDFQHAFSKSTGTAKASRNLIIILVESFESWLITNNDKLSSPIPNIVKFIQSNNVLFASKVKSQIRYGSSGDGQMIINTGLLPISTGVACISYGSNVYPNIASFYEHSALINPCQNNVWNQNQVTRSYGYMQHIRAKTESDTASIATLIRYTDTATAPFLAHAITIDTHLPFRKGENNKLNLSEKTPKILSNYINSFAYTDSILGTFLDKFKQDSVLQNSIILITGDHTILNKENLTSLRNFTKENELEFDGQNYVPLIIYSPDFKKSTFIDEVTYQMDIFPTILSLINGEDYFFKGFGVNLLDSTARHSRYYSENTAYTISEKIIRNDYISQINGSVGD